MDVTITKFYSFYKEDVLFYFGHNVFILVLCIYKSVSGYGILYMDK